MEREPPAPEFNENPQSEPRITRHQLRNLEGNGGARAGAVQQRSSPGEAADGGGRSEVSPEKGGSSEGSEGAVWPRIEIALTMQEKEDDFLVFKGTKLPHRPKKRAKPIQRNVNLMSPGSWLCDLSLERYEVREKKASKKRTRGLRAMGNRETDSE